MQYAPFQTRNVLRQISLHAIDFARSDLGQGEVGRNNSGPFVRRLLDGKQAAWCAGAVWTWHAEAAEDLGWLREFETLVPRTHGARKLYRTIGAVGEFRRLPVPGAVACWKRGKLPWQGHVELVWRVDGANYWTIAGNVGPFPAVVQVRKHNIFDAKRIGFSVLT